MNIREIYKQLYKQYGPQGWWPLKMQRSKIKNKKLRIGNDLAYGIPYAKLESFRTPFRDPYFEIALGAILTQNVAWLNVATAIAGLYQARALTPKGLLKLPVRKLEKILKSTRYYAQKAKAVRLFSDWLMKNYGGDILRLKKLPLKTARQELLKQWGIGMETADSILLYALNQPIFVVDIYTKRVCQEYGIIFKSYEDYRYYFEGRLNRPKLTRKKLALLYQECHALIVARGKDPFDRRQK